MPPIYIHNVADFSRLVVIGTATEGLFLDFKKTIDGWNAPKGTLDRVKQDAQKELCRDLAQFANTDGGTLLVGVDETKNADNIKVATGIARVDDFDGMRAWIEQAIANYGVPSTFSKTIELVAVPGGPIVAINVLPSLHTVYVWDRSNGTIEVIGRTNHGKKNLNPDEMERHIMNSSRAARLALGAAVAAAKARRVDEVVLVGGVDFLTRSGRINAIAGVIHVGDVRDTTFDLRIPIRDQHGIELLTVPYGLLREVWVDAAGRVNVLLHLGVVWNNALCFEDRPLRAPIS